MTQVVLQLKSITRRYWPFTTHFHGCIQMWYMNRLQHFIPLKLDWIQVRLLGQDIGCPFGLRKIEPLRMGYLLDGCRSGLRVFLIIEFNMFHAMMF